MEKKSVTAAQEFSEKQFTKKILFREGESTVFVLNFMPGQQLPAHKHPGTSVYLMVIQGGGTLTIDGTPHEVTEKDVIVAGGEEEFSFSNSGNENTSLYVMLNKIPDERYVQEI
ncbi:quercetin dioxygenase-like cupin family protein [Cytobacillus eiseniae]|uniref:Quercetin dioxygenase-like cupin family protein n=1 Tax=Cytobacillus eiseniae TaxID=762947 RepID=A0ABS4RB48_9BACI|nr:cupin domain-containing protein [Cytobacillus eiseniae]MBP2239565.1 quercetin dioxygenase-like cupin family protein [Cytobacillus eiseniae]